MVLTRLLPKLLILCFAFFALCVPNALAAEGVGPAKSLGGGSKPTTSAASGRDKTSGSTTTSGSDKEVLSISTAKPGNGATVSGTIGWDVPLGAGAPAKAEFLVDGAAKFSDSSAPYSGILDATKLSNGNHNLSSAAPG